MLAGVTAALSALRQPRVTMFLCVTTKTRLGQLSEFECLCVQALQEQARMLAGVIAALSARSEALVTMQTLAADAAGKRARADRLQAENHKNSVRCLCFSVV